MLNYNGSMLCHDDLCFGTGRLKACVIHQTTCAKAWCDLKMGFGMLNYNVQSNLYLAAIPKRQKYEGRPAWLGGSKTDAAGFQQSCFLSRDLSSGEL